MSYFVISDESDDVYNSGQDIRCMIEWKVTIYKGYLTYETYLLIVDQEDLIHGLILVPLSCNNRQKSENCQDKLSL